jgi:superfamily II DNA/RNA helicase
MMAASATWPALRADALTGRRALVPARQALAVAARPFAQPRASVPVLARLGDVFGTRRGFAAGGSSLAAARRPALAPSFGAPARHFARASASDEDDAMAAPESFAELGLDEALIAATDSMGLTRPTDIQAAAIPRILSGGHFLVASHTGSGKTLTYLLPVIQQIKDAEKATGARAKPKRPRVLIIGPTRELAEQVRSVAKAVSHHCKFSSELIIGGERFATQRQVLDRSLDVVVGTPGRVIKHCEENNLFLSNVTHVILDEADTLFEAGFGDEVRRLLRPLQKNPEGKQCIIVSATMAEKVAKMVSEELPDLQRIDTPSLHKSAPNLRHRFVDCPGSVDKMAVVEQIVSGDFRSGKKTMVFCNTMPSCQAVEFSLNESDTAVVMYNGDMTAEERKESMREFVEGSHADGTAVVMVCTDLAARGLDFGGGEGGKVDHVVNFDFPMNPIDYIHRSGRTARAGATGKVTSLVAKKDKILANEIDTAVKMGQPLDSASSSKAVVEARRRRAVVGAGSRRIASLAGRPTGVEEVPRGLRAARRPQRLAAANGRRAAGAVSVFARALLLKASMLTIYDT